eukprot:gb/GECG01008139.1/.p1 GENE.gb/GECG01008139.1/~~gb/GECG01008139.1/.p1  ORF type:complete len:625 (+),score=67.18 gb/GECG01008139.1/:1-1875(+)
MESFRRSKLVLPLVGLPARGKSAVGNKLLNFLAWRGFRVKLFNVGKYRRQYYGVDKESTNSSFFDNSNSTAKERREQLAQSVMHEMIDWLNEGGDIAIFDATNTTKERRNKLREVLYGRYDDSKLDVIFVECICTNEKMLHSNMLQKIQSSPDYKGMPRSEALADLKDRIRNYEKVYETIDDRKETDIAYIKLIDLQSKVIAHHIRGSVAHLIVAYLMSLHIGSRPIYVLRSGECNTPPAESGVQKTRSSTQDYQEDPTTFEPLPELGHRVDGAQHSDAVPDAITWRNQTFPPRHSSDVTSKSSTTATNELNSEKATTAQESTGYVIDWTAAMTLSDRGKVFSHAAAEFISRRLLELRKLEEKGDENATDAEEVIQSSRQNGSVLTNRICIYSSTLPRTLDTSGIMSQYLRMCQNEESGDRCFHRVDCDAWSALNPMDTGMYAGVPLQQLHDAAPEEWEAWASSKNRVAHRITGGESINDVMVRLEPLVVESEREKNPVVIITHLSTIQVLLSYFRGVPLEDCVSVAVPQHSMVEIIPTNYGYLETLVDFNLPTSESLPKPDSLPTPMIPSENFKEGFFAFSPNRAVDDAERDWYSERQVKLSDGVIANQRIIKRPFGHYNNEA